MISVLSPVFLFTFFVLCIIIGIINDEKKQNIIITIYSLVIYAFIDGFFLCVLLVDILICYTAGYCIQYYQKKRKFVLIFSVSVIVSILITFKYANYLVSSFENISLLGGYDLSKTIMPLGISFFSFMGISYICDVYTGKIDKSLNFVSVAMYLSFFPHIISGPITKARDFFSQVKERRYICKENIDEGVQIFIFGLFKKVVIADRLSIYVDTVYACPNAYSGLTILLASFSYSIQLYCDFSGYSDMAIGLASLLGMKLKRNFNMPYISRNETEFWKRWHISLSEWLQEYLYIPLGGNRCGQIRMYFNLLITMIIGGIWHGANITFVLWGVAHGVALVVHKIFIKYKKKFNINLNNKLLCILSTLFTFLYVNMCWILFRADSIYQAKNIFMRIIFLSSGINYYYVYFFVFFIILVIAYYIGYRFGNGTGFYFRVPIDTMWGKTVIIVMVLCILVYGYYGNTSFIYSQF